MAATKAAVAALEKIKAAKQQHERDNEKRKEATKAAVSALETLLTSSGLAAADVTEHIGSQLVKDAKKYANRGSGLPTERLEELQKGLAGLQEEGAVEGLAREKAAILTQPTCSCLWRAPFLGLLAFPGHSNLSKNTRSAAATRQNASGPQPKSRVHYCSTRTARKPE